MAGKIPQNFIDDLLDRTDIVELIDARVKLKKTGRNYSALCPFHDEKTPSFSVNPDKQFYYCFGCGAGGNAISFLMDYDRTDFIETVENLAQRLGMEVPREESQENIAQQKAKKSIYDLLEQASHYYQQQLRSQGGQNKAVSYLKERGLTGEIAKQFGLGYAPPGWDNLLKQLGQTGEQKKLLIEGGVLIEKEDHSGCYDRFRDRLMFPIRDNRGRTIGFGGRVFTDEKPKYLNSPETPVFHKQHELYGLYEARQANRHLQRLIMVEGYMDVIALAQFGISCAVATLGTSAGSHHMEKVFRHCNEVVFCFDGDEAGRKAADRALEAVLPLMQAGRQARFLFLPDGEDPDSLVRSHGSKHFLWLAEQAQTLSEYLFASCSIHLDLSRADDRAQLINNIIPKLQAIPAGPYQTLLLSSLSEKTGLPLDDVKQLVNNEAKHSETAPQAAQEGGHQARPVHRPRLAEAEKHIRRTPLLTATTLLLFCPQLALSNKQLWELELNTEEEQTLAPLLNYIQQHPNISSSTLLGHWMAKAPKTTGHLLGIYMAFESPEQQQQEFTDSINKIQANKKRHQNRQLIDQLDANTRLEDMSAAERDAYMAIFQTKTNLEK